MTVMITGKPRKIDRVFFQNLVVRQIRQDYLESMTGFAWMFLQPLILLAVYAFVFSTIFKARIPEADKKVAGTSPSGIPVPVCPSVAMFRSPEKPVRLPSTTQVLITTSWMFLCENSALWVGEGKS